MVNVRSTTMLLCLLILILAAPAAHATWDVNGNEVSSLGYSPRLATDDAGGAIIAWQSSSGEAEIMVQRVDAAGDLLWGWVALTNDYDNQYRPVLVADGDGGAIVAWEDYRLSTSSSIYVQRVDANGAYQWRQWGQYINHGANAPQLALYETGHAIISWEEHATYPTSIGIQKMGGGGVFQWPGEGGNDYINLGSGNYSRLLHDGTGGVVVAKSTASGLHVAADGTRDWPVEYLTDGSSGAELQVVTDGAGGGIFVWDTYDIMAQRKNSAGARIWGDDGVVVIPGGDNHHIIDDGAGGVLVAAAYSGEIIVNRINAAGGYSWSAAGVTVCSATSSHAPPRIAPDGHGGAFVVWMDNRDYTTIGNDIYAQRIDAMGTPRWAANGVPVCTAAGSPSALRLQATGADNAIVVWEDPRGSGISVYAQAINFDGSIGDPSFALASAVPAPFTVGAAENSNIGVTFNDRIASVIQFRDNMLVHGSFSGSRGGRFSSTLNSATLNPDRDFVPGEVVTVTLSEGIESGNGAPLRPACYTFTIAAEGYNGGFMSARPFDVELDPRGLCPADIADDGHLDLLVANFDSRSVSLLNGHGSGFFGPQESFTVGINPNAVIAADLDRDGAMDAVTADYASNQVSVLINNLSGGFEKYVAYATGTAPVDVCTSDFNGDGWLDLAVACLQLDAVSILFNDGDGTFAPAVHTPAGNGPFWVAAADLDGDGFADLMTANRVSDDISIYLNDGTGGFPARVDHAAADEPHTVHPADLDLDGDYDLVAGVDASQVLVYENMGNAVFAAPVSYATNSNVFTTVPSDVNGDGYLDLVYCVLAADQVRVRHNDGDGGFGAETGYDVGNGPTAVVAADFDEDGALDLATANAYDHNVTVLTNDFVLSGTDLPEAPATTSLRRNVPNPFNPVTRIEYALHRECHVRLAVYDTRGRRVATLVDERQIAQEHGVDWDGRDAAGKRMASGVYFYKLQAGDFERTRKMVLVK